MYIQKGLLDDFLLFFCLEAGLGQPYINKFPIFTLCTPSQLMDDGDVSRYFHEENIRTCSES